MQYLTPGRLRWMDLGMNLTGFTDSALAAYITRATASVNSFCGVPKIPQLHDFRGGTITGETHTWPIDAYERKPWRRVFVYHKPILTITSMRIYATETQYLNFDAAELYYELSEGWIEPASANLTSFGLFGSSVLPFIGLSEPHVKLDYTYGRLFPVAERIYKDTLLVNTWRASSGMWSAGAVTVTVNGVLRTTNYTVDRTEGTVTFTGTIPNPATDTVDVTYTGTLDPDIELATGLTSGDRLANRAFAAAGIPAGVRSFRVAEVSVDRGFNRSGSAVLEETVPVEAQELLERFRSVALAFG